MVALPAALTVTVPLALTVATFASDEDHAIVPSASEGTTLAVNWIGSSPTVAVLVVLESVIDVTGFVTVTVQSRNISFPCWVFSSTGVLVFTTRRTHEIPDFKAVSVALFPDCTRLATSSLPELNRNVSGSSISPGRSPLSVASSVPVAPLTRSIVGCSSTLVMGLYTVTAHVAVCLPSAVVAVILVSPLETAFTTPPASTVATALFDDVHVTLLSEAFSGATAAVSFVEFAPMMIVDSLSSVIPVAGTGSGSGASSATTCTVSVPNSRSAQLSGMSCVPVAALLRRPTVIVTSPTLLPVIQEI